MSQGKSSEEDEKRLATVLRAGDSIILIDNCERSIEGDFLCSMLTQESIQARILGKSERLVLPTAALVMATGNNLVLSGDVTRRVVSCRLDSGEERPDERQFDWDARDEAAEQRGDLVTAALTILRAYHVAGRPVSVSPFGSFRDWSFVRGALLWVGEADPVVTRQRLLDGDPRRGELAELHSCWSDALGRSPIELSDLRETLENGAGAKPAVMQRLHAFLIEMSGKREWNGRSIGRSLARHVDRPLGGLALRRAKGRKGFQWRLEAEEEDPGSDNSSSQRVLEGFRTPSAGDTE